MIGSSVRSLFVKGKGFPCFVSSEQDGTGKALDIALALSRAIGATKAGAIASSVREETAMDLFAEQALWPNIIMLFRSVYDVVSKTLCCSHVIFRRREAFSVLKEAGCSDEALCYEMYVSGLAFHWFDIKNSCTGGCPKNLQRSLSALRRTASSFR